MTFDITVLGANGGPLEGSTMCFLIKSAEKTYQDIINQDIKHHIVSIDAGVGLGRLTELIFDNEAPLNQLKYYKDSLTIEDAGTDLIIKKDVLKFNKDLNCSPIELAHEILSRCSYYLITHPHIDHIAGLIINSPSFGYLSNKRLYGLQSVLTYLHKHVFNNILWPDLLDIHNGCFITLNPLEPYIFDQPPVFQKLNDQYNILSFQIIHGIEVDETVPYHSTAYLLQDSITKRELLIFGDVEEDKDSMKGKNAEVWSVVSKSLLNNKLKAMIIECSTVNKPCNTPLYGHLTPFTLFRELLTLKKIIKKINPDIKDPLNGLNILITHVKDNPISKVDPKKLILKELKELNESHGLGINFTILLAGQTYTI